MAVVILTDEFGHLDRDRCNTREENCYNYFTKYLSCPVSDRQRQHAIPIFSYLFQHF
ncbi:hypothetical protein [Roseofilum casamattae]|nr:hypothetical protein [Roseofilum casamattae]